PSPPLRISLFFCHGYPPPCTLHSFPTRRSSDLFHDGQVRRELGVEDCIEAQLLERSDHLVRHVGPRRQAKLLAERRPDRRGHLQDRKSTRLNSSHVKISYAVFCLKKKTHTYKHI